MTNPFYTATGAPVQESRGTSPAVRNEFALLQTAFDEVADAIDIGAASGTSTTSLLVGTGSKSFTIQAGRAFSPGQSVVLAYNVTPTTQMTGTITSYNRTTGAVVMNVTGTNGSGTYADWTLSLNPSGGATLGANVFTGVQDWATGANIASASTVNLDTATGNRTHITGDATITAWTLTRGPRTVIFDGAPQLTYHATTNRLNSGGANVTVEAGDMAYIESDGTTVFVNVIKKSGAAVVGGGLVLVGSPVVASSSATVDITGISGSYGAYLLTGRGIRPSTDASSLLLQMTLGGSLVTSSTYKYHENTSSSAGTTYSAISSASASSIQMGGFGMGNGSSKSLDFDMMIYAPGSTALEKLVCWRGVAAGYDGTLYASNGIGQNTGTGALTALRFTPTAGAVAEGTFALYALTNS